MSLLEEVITGVVERSGVKVVESPEHGKGIVFEGVDALFKNADLVAEITKQGDQATKTNYANWGLTENGEPVCIDYPPGVKIR